MLMAARCLSAVTSFCCHAFTLVLPPFIATYGGPPPVAPFRSARGIREWHHDKEAMLAAQALLSSALPRKRAVQLMRV